MLPGGASSLENGQQGVPFLVTTCIAEGYESQNLDLLDKAALAGTDSLNYRYIQLRDSRVDCCR